MRDREHVAPAVPMLHSVSPLCTQKPDLLRATNQTNVYQSLHILIAEARIYYE
jgi:hypothetical protein